MQGVNTAVRDNILLQMSLYIDAVTLDVLQRVIEEQFINLDIRERETLPAVIDRSTDEKNKYIIELFRLKKKNLAIETKKMYLGAIKRLLTQIDKPLSEINDLDISYYLRYYEEYRERSGGKRNCATSVNNEKRFLSAFFTFMRKSKLIPENPVESAENLKVEDKPIDYYTDEEVETIRGGCRNLRDRALIECLRSTGVRVGEFETINLSDIDWITGDVRVKREKGGTNAPAYLDSVAKWHLRAYIESRTDDNPAWFVGLRQPFKRLEKTGIRSILKEIAKRQGMNCRVYPHKFRKTLGMNLINKGEGIGTVQAVLGHQDPATTAKSYAKKTPETLREVRRRAA